jgi:hypothetical protein
MLYSSYLPLGVPNWVVILPASSTLLFACPQAIQLTTESDKRTFRNTFASYDVYILMSQPRNLSNFWGKFFVFILLVLIGISQGFKTF